MVKPRRRLERNAGAPAGDDEIDHRFGARKCIGRDAASTYLGSPPCGSDRLDQGIDVPGNRNLEVRGERVRYIETLRGDLVGCGGLELDDIYRRARLRLVTTIEIEYCLDAFGHLPRNQHAKPPRFGPTALDQAPGLFLQLWQSRDRDDEARERSPVGAAEIGREILERGSHVLAGGRKQSRIIDESAGERVDCFHLWPRSRDSLIARILIRGAPTARRQRSLTRRTNLRPDQVSSTAHTFTSTSPAASPTRLTTSSVRSVATPDAFLGHDPHSMPSGSSRSRSLANRLSRSDFLLTKIIAKSSAPRATSRAPAGRGPRASGRLRGAATR